MSHEPALGALAGRLTLRWVAPPGWPEAPEGFRPAAGWEPDPYWPKPADDWRYWQVDGDPEVLLAFLEVPAFLEPEQTWFAPPGWPVPPAGFMPNEGWQPDPRWPAAPPGWQFWRVTDEARAAFERSAVATRARRLAALNDVEDLMSIVRSVATRYLPPVTPTADSQATAQQRFDVWKAQAAERFNESTEITRASLRGLVSRGKAAPPPSIRVGLEYATEAIEVGRDLLVRSISLDAEVEDVYFQWADEIARRASILIAQVREVAALKARQTYGQGSPTWSPSSRVTSGADWQTAEQLAASALRQMGYADARVTVGGADGGLDVQGSGVAAQVKYTGKPVGRPQLQQLIGAAHGARPIFFARSGYSTHALEYAAQTGIALFEIELPHSITAVNGPATQLAAYLR